jgi:hypothetical protein
MLTLPLAVDRVIAEGAARDLVPPGCAADHAAVAVRT